MVDLDPLNEEDIQTVHDMLSKHCEYTNSAVGRFVLNDFDNQVKNFIKVFPKDYKKALHVRGAIVAQKV
jgi:glutamate synthase (NADPH/NADH) large chain